MKIVFIIQNISRAAGTENATIKLVNSLVSKGFETEIISLYSLANSEPFFQLADKTIIHHIGNEKNKLFSLLKIKNILRKNNADVICGTGHNISFFLPIIKNSGSKTIALEHIDFESIPKLSRILMKFAYSRLSAVVVLSDTARMKMLPLLNKITVIPNQIRINNEKSSLTAERIIMVGRISKEKGYERTVTVARKLQEKFPNWRIDIYGGCDDDYQTLLEELFSKNNLQNVRFHAPIKNIGKEYLQSSIFLITSNFEAFGLVILEAKSYGLPVVGFRNEGTQTLIKDKIDGFIVDTEYEAFSKIELLINDTQLRKNFVQKGLQNLKEFEEDKILSKWINLIDKIKN